jgi:hypothetical protein
MPKTTTGADQSTGMSIYLSAELSSSRLWAGAARATRRPEIGHDAKSSTGRGGADGTEAATAAAAHSNGSRPAVVAVVGRSHSTKKFPLLLQDRAHSEHIHRSTLGTPAGGGGVAGDERDERDI